MTGVQEHNFAGIATFPTHEKKPLAAGWQKVTPDVFAAPTAQFGVRLTDDMLVIDIDPRHFPNPETNTWFRLCDNLSIERNPATRIVSTPSGGFHIYFKKPENFRVIHTIHAYPGLEFKSAGRYVIGAGSTTDDGRAYSVFKDLPIATAPQALLAAIKKTDVSDLVVADTVNYYDTPENIARFKKYLAATELPSEGRRNEQTYKISCRARDFGLSPEAATAELIPWFGDSFGAVEVAAAVRNAYKYNTEPQGVSCPERMQEKIKDFEKKEQTLDYATIEFDMSDKGVVKPTLKSCVSHMRMDSRLAGMRYNGVSYQIEFTTAVPWDTTRDIAAKEYCDDDTAHAQYYLACKYNVAYQDKIVGNASLIIAQMRRYNPVVDYLDNLKWDGKSRIKDFFATYCGAKNGKANEEISRLLWLSAVKRAYVPGCKMDYLFVLEGEQGIGKSTLVKIMGAEYYTSMDIDPRNKDTIAIMKGHWIVEIPEMVSLLNHGSENVKKFLSESKDCVRLSYAKTPKTYPRASIFIGTINPSGTGYLKDETGNRRFLPVFLKRVDLEGVKRDRDQLFAEAVSRFRAGEETYTQDEETLRAIREEVQARQEGDSWTDLVQIWVQAQKRETLTQSDIWEQCLHMNPGSMKRSDQLRLSKLLNRIGYEKATLGKAPNTYGGYRVCAEMKEQWGIV